MDASRLFMITATCFLGSLFASLTYLRYRYRLSPYALWCPPCLQISSASRLDLSPGSSRCIKAVILIAALCISLLLSGCILTTIPSMSLFDALLRAGVLALWAGVALGDIFWAQIPNLLLGLLSGLSLALLLMSSNIAALQLMLGFGLFGLVFLFACIKGKELDRVLGGGDIKALFPYLLSLQLENTLGLSLGFIFGLVLSVVVSLLVQKSCRLIPFIPCLSFSVFGSFFF